MKEIFEAVKKLNKQNAPKNEFPLHALPEKMRNIIQGFKENRKFPVDFSAGSMLTAACSAIGKTYSANLDGWVCHPIIYMCIVGDAGSNKSSPLKSAIKPLNDISSKMFKKYEIDLARWKEDKAIAESSKQKLAFNVDKPEAKQTIIKNFTIEGLFKAHKTNERGLLVYVDELQGFFNAMSQYKTKGADEQEWLDFWNGSEMVVNRAGSELVRLESTRLSVIGGIQPLELSALLSGSRSTNGMIDRFLFVSPEGLGIAIQRGMKQVHEQIEQWSKTINKIYNVPSNGNVELNFHAQAKEVYYDWQEKNAIACNESGDRARMSVNSKIQEYVVRISLVLHLIKWAEDEDSDSVGEINMQTVKDSIIICEYFRENALKIRRMVENPDAKEILNKEKLEMYDLLPNEFKTGEAVKIIVENRAGSERSLKNFLRDKNFFDKIGHGAYMKIM